MKFQPLLALLILAALLVGASGNAFAARAPKDPDQKGILPIEHIGGKPGRVQDTTSAQLIVSGSGMLYELCAYGTAAVLGKGAMAFATEVASTIGSFAVPARALSPLVLGTAYVQASGHSLANSVTGCWRPAVPIRFESGLTVKVDDTSVAALVIYRLDTGVNP